MNDLPRGAPRNEGTGSVGGGRGLGRARGREDGGGGGEVGGLVRRGIFGSPRVLGGVVMAVGGFRERRRAREARSFSFMLNRDSL